MSKQTIRIPVMVTLVGARVALADPTTAKLSAELEPLRGLPVAEREAKVCADAANILALANAVTDAVPAGVPIGKSMWSTVASGVSISADTLTLLCARKDHAQKSPVDGKLLTAANEIVSLYASLDEVVDAAKPRTLTPSLASVRKALDRLDWQAKKFCSHARAVVTALDKVKPPANAPQAWSPQLAGLRESARSTRDTACEKRKHEPEEVAGLEPELAHAFDKLVLLLPPNAN